MVGEKRIPAYRQVMGALGIKPGGSHTVEVRQRIEQWIKQGVTVDYAIKSIPNTPEYKRWVKKTKNQIFLHAGQQHASQSEERVDTILSILGIVAGSPHSSALTKSLRMLTKKLHDDAEIVLAVKKSPEWKRWNKKTQDALIVATKNEKRREEALQARLEARVAKGKKIASMPRARRYKAWGCVPIRVITNKIPLFVKEAIFSADKFYSELKTFAIDAQKERDLRAIRLLAQMEHQKEEALEQAELARKRKAARLQRLSLHEQEEETENNQAYMRAQIPAEKLHHFRRWFIEHHGNSPELLRTGVDEYSAIFNFSTLPDVTAQTDSEEEKITATAASFLNYKSSHKKKEGKIYGVKSRPEQTKFAAAVRLNCFATCVATGSKVTRRCEAAHLIEHKNNGLDHFTNGLWLRADIHSLFDAGLCAFEPVSLVLIFSSQVLAQDVDLQQYHGRRMGPLRSPIDLRHLEKRWAEFERMTNS
ncbi:HNH endonuclease signature motif containing protein [Pectobacterium polaris]|uniref:HNH endonuclease signature motif containing protein n=1 Tax=Pectobacterium polaris TaxID=2042057 RepID=UPI001F29B2E5|nr:HNH endonuclease signature motif containing protein [Pectobacterium polaris]